MPTITGILETAIYSQDLVLAADFYNRLFHFETLFESERLVAFKVAPTNILLLFLKGATHESVQTSGGLIPAHTGSAGESHFALSIPLEELHAWKEQLAAQGIPLESEVTWPGRAISLYFRDPDHNLLELVTAHTWPL